MESVTINSKGIDWLLLEVGWTKEGVKWSFKVDPRVEEFFKSFSGNQFSPANILGGRDWTAIGEAPLQCYQVSEDAFHHANHFFLGYQSFPMFVDQFPNKINLSFLQVVGASEGKEFLVKTPLSKGGKKDVRMMIERGMNEFAREYLMFGKMVIRVSSFEV